MLLALVVAQVVYLPALGIQLVRTAPPGSLWAPWHAAARVPWAQLVPLAMAVFVLSYVQDVSCAREVAAQGAPGAPNVSPDAELLANGATNVGTGLVGGMPVAASTPLEGSMDSPSVRVLVVSGAVTLLVVMLFSVTLAGLPMAMLAANLIRHAGHLIGAGVRGLDQTPRRQLVAALATALSVMTLGPLNGMLIGVALTLLDRPWKRADSTHP